MSDTIEQHAEAMAAELLSDPVFKTEMRALLAAAFRRAFEALTEDPRIVEPQARVDDALRRITLALDASIPGESVTVVARRIERMLLEQIRDLKALRGELS